MYSISAYTSNIEIDDIVENFREASTETLGPALYSPQRSITRIPFEVRVARAYANTDFIARTMLTLAYGGPLVAPIIDGRSGDRTISALPEAARTSKNDRLAVNSALGTLAIRSIGRASYGEANGSDVHLEITGTNAGEALGLAREAGVSLTALKDAAATHLETLIAITAPAQKSRAK